MASLIPQAEMAGPSAVARVKGVVNDVRLPSRAALEQRLGVELSATSTGQLELKSPGSKNVTLSALARAVSTLLTSQTDVALKIRSSEPLWLHARPPPAAQLTVRLAQTVALSGLFYESHLQQFAAGLRPLALMVREPQAGLVAASSPTVSEAAASAASDAAGVGTLAADKTVPAAALSAASTTVRSRADLLFSTVYGQDGKSVNSALLLREPAGAIQAVKTTVSGPLEELHTIGTLTAQADLAPAVLTASSAATLPAAVPASSPAALTTPVLGMPEAAGLDVFIADAAPGVGKSAATLPAASSAAALTTPVLGMPEAAGLDMFIADTATGVGKHAMSAAPASATTVSASAAAGTLQDTNPHAVVSGPLPFATAYGQDGRPEKKSLFLQETIRDAQTTKVTAAEPQSELRSSSAVSTVIHPEAMGLVRQQLELLSLPVFRWCGQAWPGTPLEWDIQREQPEDAQTSAGLASPQAWTTNLTISMPVLKSVQARLTLAGDTLQVRLVCDEDATLAVLDESRDTLAQRFAPLGLQLAILHMGMAVTADGNGLPKT